MAYSEPLVPGSPPWWLERLSRALDKRQKDVKAAQDWYCGEHPIPLPPAGTFAAVDQEARLAFMTLSRLAITNLLPPIVNVPAAKQRIEGFRFGQSTTGTDNDGWAIFQRNGLDADHLPANKNALKVGSNPILVWPDDDTGLATITVEDPAQSIVGYKSGAPRVRAAALKRWVDESGYVYATLYMPDFTYKYQSTQTFDSPILVEGARPWKPRTVPGEEWPLPTPFGKLPMYELRANRHELTSEEMLHGGGVPEFWGQLNEQRKANDSAFKLLTTMEHQAIRQRYAIGWDYPSNPDGTPNETAIKKAAASSLWLFKNKGDDPTNVTVGEFQQAQLEPFLAVMKLWIMVMCANSDTPHFAYQMPDMANVAADLLAKTNAAADAKARNHQDQFGQPWQAVISHALTIEGNPLGDDTSASVIWTPVTDVPALEKVQIAQGMHDLGVPDVVVMASLPGSNQQDAARWAKEKALADLRSPEPAPQVPPPAPLPVP